MVRRSLATLFTGWSDRCRGALNPLEDRAFARRTKKSGLILGAICDSWLTANNKRSPIAGREILQTIAGPIACAAILVLSSTAGSAEDLREKGRKLSETYCSRCHVVGDTNKFGGISSTPSFRIIVHALEDWRDRFETFHARLPHPSVIRIEGTDPLSTDPPTTHQVHLKLEDIEAFVAYAETFVKE